MDSTEALQVLVLDTRPVREVEGIAELEELRVVIRELEDMDSIRVDMGISIISNIRCISWVWEVRDRLQEVDRHLCRWVLEARWVWLDKRRDRWEEWAVT